MLFVITCAGLVWYFEYEKERMKRKRIAEASKGVGRPKVGGEFELVDDNGHKFTSDMMKGKFCLVSANTSVSLELRGAFADRICPVGLLRLHALSRHLPRGTRQDGTHD